jgi:hypothetical protein
MMFFKTEVIHLKDKDKIQTWVLGECLLQIMSYETHKQESDSTVDILKKGYQLFESFKPLMTHESSVSEIMFSYIKKLYEDIIHTSHQNGINDYIHALKSLIGKDEIYYAYQQAFQYIDTLYE